MQSRCPPELGYRHVALSQATQILRSYRKTFAFTQRPAGIPKRQQRPLLLPKPRRRDRVLRNRRGRFTHHADQLAAPQMLDRPLQRTLGQPGAVAQHLVAEESALAAQSFRHRVKPQVKDEGGRPFVVADEVWEKNVDNVRIDGKH
jgi:hypothetical protein